MTVSDTLSFLAHEEKVTLFRAFLTRSGCTVLDPVSQWEVLRFIVFGRINVIHRNRRGEFSAAAGPDIDHAATAFLTGKPWSPIGRPKRLTSSARRQRIRSQLLRRDGSKCFFCGSDLGDDVTIEELLPVAHGGVRVLANCALAHAECNVKAGHLSVVEKVRLRDQMRGGTKR
ncbi:hypothetical protein [Nitrobacter sp.]|uniref:HNH endonuclease n=1 Tax=Nitrobacter sp. TaxID=29420 RepID=UPI0029CAC3E6|nr:hypothetical protein [Nitrobacter sp.]